MVHVGVWGGGGAIMLDMIIALLLFAAKWYKVPKAGIGKVRWLHMRRPFYAVAGRG